MNNYDDIINLEYHGSSSMKRMSVEARAAQFAPFAALTGHNAAIRETARITSKITELSPDEQLSLSRRLYLALDLINQRPLLSITYFIRDSRKTGGKYVNLTGYIKKFDEHDKTIVLSDNSIINIRDIVAIEGEIFDTLYY